MVAVLKAILAFLADALAFIAALPIWVATKIFQLISGAVLSILNAIPVPDFVAAMGSSLSAVPSSVWYFLGPMQFGLGLSWMLGAYVLRFLIRRIPVIG